MDIGNQGFILEDGDLDKIKTSDVDELSLVWPILNGSDFMSYPDHDSGKHVINFTGLSLKQAQEYPILIKIVEERVRANLRGASREKKWWLYYRSGNALYSALDQLEKCLVTASVSKFIGFDFMLPHTVFTNALNIIANDSFATFATLQNTLHESWARYYGSSLETRNRYNVSDVFETFPFPADTSPLEAIGERYHETRRHIMLARQEGLTDTYNRFHDPDEDADDIEELRRLHVEMDNAVASAYGWDDLDLGHDFHETAQGIRFTISESARREVLTRLLKLNHERYAQECADGLHKKADCQKFFTEHPHLKGQVSASTSTIGSKPTTNAKSTARRFGVRPFGSDDLPEQLDLFDDDDDGNPKQKKLF